MVSVADVDLGPPLPLKLIPNYGGAHLSKTLKIYQLLNYLMASNQQ